VGGVATEIDFLCTFEKNVLVVTLVYELPLN
jgi:hypothetical protein